MGLLIYFLVLMFSAAILIYLVYMRAKRKTILEKYKKDSQGIKVYKQIMKLRWLILFIVLFAGSLAGIAWEVVNTSPDSKSSPLFVLGFMTFIAILAGLVVFFQQQSENKAK